LKIYYN